MLPLGVFTWLGAAVSIAASESLVSDGRTLAAGLVVCFLICCTGLFLGGALEDFFELAGCWGGVALAPFFVFAAEPPRSRVPLWQTIARHI